SRSSCSCATLAWSQNECTFNRALRGALKRAGLQAIDRDVRHGESCCQEDGEEGRNKEGTRQEGRRQEEGAGQESRGEEDRRQARAGEAQEGRSGCPSVVFR